MYPHHNTQFSGEVHSCVFNLEKLDAFLVQSRAFVTSERVFCKQRLLSPGSFLSLEESVIIISMYQSFYVSCSALHTPKFVQRQQQQEEILT